MADKKQNIIDSEEVWLTVYGAAKKSGNNLLAGKAAENLHRLCTKDAVFIPEQSLEILSYLLTVKQGFLEYITGRCSKQDIEQAQSLHIVSSTELKQHIRDAQRSICNKPELMEKIERLSYLTGIYAAIQYQQRQDKKSKEVIADAEK